METKCQLKYHVMLFRIFEVDRGSKKLLKYWYLTNTKVFLRLFSNYHQRIKTLSKWFLRIVHSMTLRPHIVTSRSPHIPWPLHQIIPPSYGSMKNRRIIPHNQIGVVLPRQPLHVFFLCSMLQQFSNYL